MSQEQKTAEIFDGAMVHPIIQGWPEFWWMSEEDRAIAFDGRARAHGGEGYRYRSRED